MIIGENELRAILDGLEGVTPGPWLSALWAGSPSTGPDAGILSGPKMVARDKSTLHTPEDASHIARLDPDTVRAIVTLALEALDRRKDGLETVSVKPLEWSEWGNGGFIARANDLLEYSIAKGHQHSRLYVAKHQYIGAFDSVEAAKAAAQQDFGERVKSCLTSIGVEAGK